MLERLWRKAPVPDGSEEVDIGRRNFLAGGVALVGTAAIAGTVAEIVHNNPELFRAPSREVLPEIPQPETVAVEPESIEVTATGSEQFEAYTIGFREWLTMPRTTVLFVDRNNVPIGELVPFHDIEAKKTVVKDGVEVEIDYLYTPVAKDAQGNYEVGNVAREWGNLVQERLAAQMGISTSDITRISVAEDFVRALSQSDEPELQAGILNGTIKNNLDIVHYFGNKPVRGAEHLTRIEYVREMVIFNNGKMSETVQNELRSLLPALCGKESKFNDDLESVAGAKGISQFMRDTWKGLGMGEYGDSQPLSRQVEAMGKHCDNIYNELMSDGVEELLEQYIVPLFATRADFERDFLVPCMINSYNPGAGTMRRAIKEFLAVTDPSDFLERSHGRVGKDVFFELNRFALQSDIGLLANFQERSAEYTGYIYALRGVFTNEASQLG